jgi:hypothetical protein
MGVYQSLGDLAALSLDFVDYEPVMDITQTDQYYAGWQAAVQRVL